MHSVIPYISNTFNTVDETKSKAFATELTAHLSGFENYQQTYVQQYLNSLPNPDNNPYFEEKYFRTLFINPEDYIEQTNLLPEQKQQLKELYQKHLLNRLCENVLTPEALAEIDESGTFFPQWHYSATEWANLTSEEQKQSLLKAYEDNSHTKEYLTNNFTQRFQQEQGTASKLSAEEAQAMVDEFRLKSLRQTYAKQSSFQGQSHLALQDAFEDFTAQQCEDKAFQTFLADTLNDRKSKIDAAIDTKAIENKLTGITKLPAEHPLLKQQFEQIDIPFKNVLTSIEHWETLFKEGGFLKWIPATVAGLSIATTAGVAYLNTQQQKKTQGKIESLNQQ